MSTIPRIPTPTFMAGILEKRFGEEVKLLKSRRSTKGWEFLLLWNGKRRWIPSNFIRWRKTLESIFSTPTEARKLQYAKIAAKNTENALSRAQKRLNKLGVTDVTVLRQVGAGQKRDVICLYNGVEIPVQGSFVDYDCQDELSFYKRLYAWTRFKLRISLRFSDKEWADKIKLASSGNIRPVRYKPQGFGPNEFVCNRCRLKFPVRFAFNKANYVLRCPDCDRKQSKNYSTSGVAWIKDLETRFGIKIQHAESPKGEARIALSNGISTQVDGLYKKVVFEFHGSRWHGDPTQFYVDDRPNPYDKTQTTLSLLKKTMQREVNLLNSGYHLIRIWEADFAFKERYQQWLLLNSKRLKKYLTPK